MNTANTTLFISDLHLSPQEPRITNTFLHFLKIATSADAVYILGDLFEAYVGDDDDSGFMKQVTEAVTQFTKNGPPTFFMRGNRDLLVGKKWMQRSGMQLLEDPTVINLYQQKNNVYRDSYNHRYFWISLLSDSYR